MIADKIKNQSQSVRDKATELSQRLELLEKWLGALPGRVETFVSLTCTDQIGKQELEFQLTRLGKDWKILVKRKNEDRVRPLTDSTLRIKMAAVYLIPALLSSLLSSQIKLQEELSQSVKDFDRYAEEFGIRDKEPE